MFPNTSKEYREEPADHLPNLPPFRRLKAYAFDPSLSLRLETAAINHTTFEIPWDSKLKPGPRGDYIEVVDYDPASGCWYDPVDLNATHILAQDGLPPSQGNPQFHQQMVYAVAMNTISNFQRALGRQVMWSSRDVPASKATGAQRDQYVPTLRIYPHALRAANAYYSPKKKALLFGYFQGPTGTVFSCLSQDIVVHETTHALLDGMHRRYVEDNHPDTLAFHEAFADLVALFQHFTLPEVLKHQLERTRGNLEAHTLLGELAQEFGEATGRYGALRSAIGEIGPDGEWHLIKPNPRRLHEAAAPHERGSILVAAVFSAFLAIYKARTKGLLAIASAGSGKLPEGILHPSLIEALALQATKTARHFLYMSIRALDYCPPFDITFGDYLRALITADYDMVPNDKYGYRVALIESFRRWGIVPEGLKTLSEEQLRWPYAKLEYEHGWNALAAVADNLKELISNALYVDERKNVFDYLKDARIKTHEFLRGALTRKEEQAQREAFMKVTGLNLSPEIKEVASQLYRRPEKAVELPSFEVHSVLPTLRVTPDGEIKKQLIISVTQRVAADINRDDPSCGTFDFRGGSTLIFDMDGDPTLRYAITRPIGDQKRLEAIQAYKSARSEKRFSLRETYFSGLSLSLEEEPFCFLHDEY
ncbi:hypothetical protein [Noviherbaspirillum massiliense]|uniref:hypothetical protein n=1 Tax=Noviherbaspirillum massiliense TaxID=1465823 RepID=UPI0003078461|nr:hypothetical protein [Noviherbaspirillum massiliense]